MYKKDRTGNEDKINFKQETDPEVYWAAVIIIWLWILAVIFFSCLFVYQITN